MRALPSLLTLLSLLSGLNACGTHCGTFEVHTGYSIGDPGEEVYYDFDDAFERCGAQWGSFASKDLGGAGQAWISFIPDHRNSDIYWALTEVFMDLRMDSSELEQLGEVSGISGSAQISMSGLPIAAAVLSSGTVEVLDMEDPEPPCTPFREQRMELRWDVMYGSQESDWYAAQGQDWIGFSLDDDCR